MARRRRRHSHCAGRTSKGRIKKGYRLKRGSCPVKA